MDQARYVFELSFSDEFDYCFASKTGEVKINTVCHFNTDATRRQVVWSEVLHISAHMGEYRRIS